MEYNPMSATRRAVLGASTVGLCAAALKSPPVGSERISNAPEPGEVYALKVAADRTALARLGEVGLGTRVVLSEPLRRGEFVARSRRQHEGQIAADPHQAFCVPSEVDRDTVWVREFAGPASLDWGGAKGDGVSDDAPFINAMLRNQYVNWFRIEDRRTHLLKEPLLISRPLTLVGAGVQNSVLRVDRPIDAVRVTLPSASEHGLQLSDFGIANVMSAGVLAGGSGIRLDLTYLAKISNIRITNCWNGVHCSRSGLSNFDSLHVNGCVNAGMLFDGGQNFDIRVTGFTISGGKYSIILREMCDEMIFADGVCSSSLFALYTDAASYSVNQRPEFCRFSRVSFDSCANGLDLANCTDLVFDACFVSCRPNLGAEIGVRGPVENVQFVATTFFNNAKSAALVGPRATATDFLACKFVSNCTLKPNAFDTLTFASGCGPFAVSQSRFQHGWDVTSTPRYQVKIERGGAGAYVLMGNHFAPGGAGALLDERMGAQRSLLGNMGL